MPLIIRAVTDPDGSPVSSTTVYLVSGGGSPEYMILPGQAWNTLEITANAVEIPDRDFANTQGQPPRSTLAYFVEKGYVTVYDTTLPGFLTPDQIRNYA